MKDSKKDYVEMKKNLTQTKMKSLYRAKEVAECLHIGLYAVWLYVSKKKLSLIKLTRIILYIDDINKLVMS